VLPLVPTKPPNPPTPPNRPPAPRSQLVLESGEDFSAVERYFVQVLAAEPRPDLRGLRVQIKGRLAGKGGKASKKVGAAGRRLRRAWAAQLGTVPLGRGCWARGGGPLAASRPARPPTHLVSAPTQPPP
jgi:hypothetical protein